MKAKSKSFNKQMFLAVYFSLLLEEFKEIEIKRNITNNKLNLTDEQKEHIILAFKQKEKIISIIQQYLIKWPFRRLSSIDQALLFLSSYFILNSLCDDSLTISIALEYTKKYSDIEKSQYMNAVLDKISKNKDNLNYHE